MKPPRVYELTSPNNQRTIRTTAIVSSMLGASLKSFGRGPSRSSSHCKKHDQAMLGAPLRGAVDNEPSDLT